MTSPQSPGRVVDDEARFQLHRAQYPDHLLYEDSPYRDPNYRRGMPRPKKQPPEPVPEEDLRRIAESERDDDVDSQAQTRPGAGPRETVHQMPRMVSEHQTVFPFFTR